MDYKKIEDQINLLISTGRIKDEEDLAYVPIDEICPKYGICAKDLACYRCYKSNNHTCKYNCMDES